MDTLTAAQRSERMSRVRARDTRPELLVRRIAHGLGYRYRLHQRDLPGKPDLVFPARRKVILIHGCFWHRHPDPACKLARMPKSRLEFWEPKFARNRARDEKVLEQLAESGWTVLTLWECELGDRSQVETRIKEFLG
jgi:DNA mismatch endonuclease (patch repair protein)